MLPSLKPLSAHVIVITGASSGIGLATARTAARAGAKVVLAARNAEALRHIESELTAEGHTALAIPTDVTDPAAIAHLAQSAVDRFGAIDTWVNNAGVTIYGHLTDVSLPDAQQLFQTNYFGQVHGTLEAIRRMEGHAGTIINVGSTTSDLPVPLQGHYSASKHALKAFTDALRMELEIKKSPISITLIKPASIDTPYPQHARNYLPEEPQIPDPLYDPQLVANAILHAATHRTRDIIVGGAGKAAALLAAHAPSRLADKILEHAATTSQTQKDHPPEHPEGTLFHPNHDNDQYPKEHGHPGRHVAHSSLYTTISLHPLLTTTLAAAATALLLSIFIPTARTLSHRPS